MPRSTLQAVGIKGTVEVLEEYRAGLKDLGGFSHVILLWHVDRSTGSHLEVVPPKQTQTRGLSATRPPNPIGLSIVRLDRIEDGVLHVDGSRCLMEHLSSTSSRTSQRPTVLRMLAAAGSSVHARPWTTTRR